MIGRFANTDDWRYRPAPGPNYSYVVGIIYKRQFAHMAPRTKLEALPRCSQFRFSGRRPGRGDWGI